MTVFPRMMTTRLILEQTSPPRARTKLITITRAAPVPAAHPAPLAKMKKTRMTKMTMMMAKIRKKVSLVLPVTFKAWAYVPISDFGLKSSLILCSEYSV